MKKRGTIIFHYIGLGYFRKTAMWDPNPKGWHTHTPCISIPWCIDITFLFSQQNIFITKTYFYTPGSSMGTTTTKSFNNSNTLLLALVDILLLAATHLLRNVKMFEYKFWKINMHNTTKYNFGTL